MRSLSLPPPAARAVFALVTALTASTANPQPRPAPAPLAVHITAPHAGVGHSGETMTLSATVSDPTVRTALLTAHGITYEVPVEDGRVEQTVVVLPGNNRLGVTVQRGGESVSDAVTFRAEGEPVEMVVLLGWASRGEIIDLWVREPTGETCKWDHRETNGGRLLDFSTSAIGFGSQAYLRPQVVAGRYRVKVHYWSARSREVSSDEGNFSQDLERLHAIDDRLAASPPAAERATLTAERAALTARMDRWGLPSGPQTPLRAEVLLFPNTPQERRWRFEVTAQRTGQLQTLGEVEVTDAMIRAARAALSRGATP